LRGPELSLLVVCNGDTDAAVPLAPAQDFKRIRDGDTGPNTGGMGAYSPVPVAGPRLIEQVMATSVYPTLHALEREGVSYRGVLYAGLMLTPDGPKVIEYNVRFGDPECEVIIPRLSNDLGELCRASASGEPLPVVSFPDEAQVTVVLASEQYPAAPRTGDPISGLDAAESREGVVVFHAGTARAPDGSIVTAGGRVLAVTGAGATIDLARAAAYDAVSDISWPGMQYRSDIAREAAAT